MANIQRIALALFFLCSCAPKVVYQRETVIEYRDRTVHDTATFYVDREVEKIVTKDTVSHLENKWAKSDASVSDGLLSHSLESIPQKVEVPVEVHVTDTLYKEAEIQTVIKEVEKELSWWQKFRMDSFWFLLVFFIAAVFAIVKKLSNFVP